jgi:hypothetical protein
MGRIEEAEGRKMSVHEAFALLLLGTIATSPCMVAQGPQIEPPQIVRTFQFVVTEGKGQPVTDLQTEELRVSDGKESVPLAFSQFVPPHSAR